MRTQALFTKIYVARGSTYPPTPYSNLQLTTYPYNPAPVGEPAAGRGVVGVGHSDVILAAIEVKHQTIYTRALS